MSIIYTIIATGKETILTSFDRSKGGNFPLITLKLLKRIKSDGRKSYEYKTLYRFHYIKEQDITYLCMADSNLKPGVA